MEDSTQKNTGSKARILCVWELGGNLGHLTSLRLFVDQALERGHHVTVALRELQYVDTVFEGCDVDIFQAPYLRLPIRPELPRIISYVEMVIRQAFSCVGQLQSLTAAWKNLFRVTQPDLVIYDHSPTALIASSGACWKKWVIGSGFLIPQQDEFLGMFPGTPKSEANAIRLRESEQLALDMINQVLKAEGEDIWASLGPWFDQCDQQLFLTLPETDHYGARHGGQYLGVKQYQGGATPSWPARASDKRHAKIFVYVNEFPGLDQLLAELLERQARVIVYCKNLSLLLRQKYQSQIEFADVAQDLKAICEQADYLVSNANHGTVIVAYVAGLPQLFIPLQQEQYLLAKRVSQSSPCLIESPTATNYHNVIAQLFSLSRTTNRLSLVSSPELVSERIAAVFKLYDW